MTTRKVSALPKSSSEETIDAAAEVAPDSGATPEPGKSSRFTNKELTALSTKKGLTELLRTKRLSATRALNDLHYEAELDKLQIELVRLQRTVQLSGRRIAILFEGRDAAGKGGTIRRFIEHLNPRTARVVALPKPTDVERGSGTSSVMSESPQPG